MSYDTAAALILTHMAHLPGVARLRDLMPDIDFDDAVLTSIVDAAAHYSCDVLDPFDRVADGLGCRLEDGRVKTAQGHQAAWQGFVEGGWPTLEAPPEYGGAGLPLVVHSACEELFNRASPSFGMLATPTRCSVRLIHKYADEAIKAEWLPKLIAGEWGGAICISEPDAGSDVARVRTMATPQADGAWQITGEKMWISFGDHDLTPRIGHMLLARTPDAPPGTAGLSLFLVPSVIDGQRNAVATRRIEEKLGLHASPTCVLGFEGARGWLIGERHRGLSQLFTMIIGMRISVGSQGAALATAAADVALSYARERRQGGSAGQPPVTIDRHGDVQRMILGMQARAEMARALVLTTSITSDLAEREVDNAARAHHRDLLGWLLPITKNFGAESGFSVPSDAIQVLGGAGYTREWPVEKYLRDARVLSIYEGTSGMQALDLLHRRALGGEGAGLAAFLREVETELGCDDLSGADIALRDGLAQAVGYLKQATDYLRDRADGPDAQQAGAYSYLRLAELATTGWIALRLSRHRETEWDRRIASCAAHWLRILPASAQREYQIILGCNDLLIGFDQL